jgi:hypothetical protein
MLELADGIGAVSRLAETRAVARGDLVRADDDRAGKTGRHGLRLQYREAQGHGGGRLPGLGILGHLRRDAIERQAQPRQQFAPVVRGRCQYDCASLCHHFVLTSFFSDDIIRAPCRSCR